MKNIFLIIALVLAGFAADAQSWRFEIQPLYFSAAGTEKYNDTADRLIVKVTGNISGNNMELYCELQNSRTDVAVRTGRMYYVPISILSLLIANQKDIAAINQVLAAFDITAIAQIE